MIGKENKTYPSESIPRHAKELVKITNVLNKLYLSGLNIWNYQIDLRIYSQKLMLKEINLLFPTLGFIENQILKYQNLCMENVCAFENIQNLKLWQKAREEVVSIILNETDLSLNLIILPEVLNGGFLWENFSKLYNQNDETTNIQNLQMKIINNYNLGYAYKTKNLDQSLLIWNIFCENIENIRENRKENLKRIKRKNLEK